MLFRSTMSEKHRSAGSKNSNRLSDRTVIPSTDSRTMWHDASEEKVDSTPASPRKLDKVHEDEADVQDSARSEASSSALWCEICETGGHDILTCKDMFGQNANGKSHQRSDSQRSGGLKEEDEFTSAARPAPLVSRKSSGGSSDVTPKAAPVANPMDMVGMVAGKTSGRVDEEKWCALCERDGHDSLDCPFEDAF